MNLGRRKARVVLSVAIEAALMVVPLHFGDKSGTSSAAHMQHLRTHRDGQDAFWGIVGGKSGAFIWRRERERAHVTQQGPTWIGYGLCITLKKGFEMENV